MNQNPLTLKALCITREGPKEFDLTPVRLWMGEDAIRLKSEFEAFKHNASCSSIYRARRVLIKFTQFLSENKLKPTQDPNIFAHYLRRYREHMYMERGEKLVSSVTDNWRVFKKLIGHFQLKRVFPSCSIPFPIQKSANFDILHDRKRHNHLGPSLNEFESMRSTTKVRLLSTYQGPLTTLPPFASDEEWLDAYYRDQRTAFDLLRKVAIDEVRKAREIFFLGCKLAEECDVDNIKNTYKKTGSLCDPLSTSPGTLPSLDVDTYVQFLSKLKKNNIITTRQLNATTYYLVNGCSRSAVGKLIDSTAENARYLIRVVYNIIFNLPASKEKTIILERFNSLDCYHKSRSKSPISFFSPNHPDGLKNFLGWIADQSNGIIYRTHLKDSNKATSSVPGAEWLHSHGGTEQIRQYFGLTPATAVAMAIIIVGETAINVQALRDLKVCTKGESYFLSGLDNPEFTRLRVPKLRKRSEIIKAIQVSHENEINAFECFQLALLMTQRLRENCRLENLWLYKDTQKSDRSSFILGNQAWKGAWRTFINQHDELAILRSRNPLLSKIRGTAGILEWFETDGCRSSAAKKLGNSVSVSVKHYIPQEIQEAFYRRQIRRFQNLLILTATAGEDYAYKALNMSSHKEVDKALRTVLADPTITDQRLIRRLNSKADQTLDFTEEKMQDRKKYAFIWSPHNIALVLSFANHIKEQKFASPDLDCESDYDGLIPKLWIDLASHIRNYASNTVDRGHKIIFKKAILQMKTKTVNFEFPPMKRDIHEK